MSLPVNELAPSAGFADTYAQRLAVVEAGVHRFSEQLVAEKADQRTHEARDAFVNLLNGPGKRIRGVLTTIGYNLGRELYPETNAPADDTIIGDAAGVLEAVHASLLLFDDMADHASLRRNLPTVHAHLGNSMSPDGARTYAELIGLIARDQADITLAKLPLPAENRVAAAFILHHGLELTGYGQGRDLLPASLGSGLRHALEVAMGKTSHYTFALPLQYGAALAGAPISSWLECTGYAFPAGLAFQLHDDIISTFGDPAVTGKDAMSDIREGKETFLVALARKRADALGRAVLQKALGNAALDQSTFEQCLEVIKGSGALQTTRDLVSRLTDQAIKSLPKEWPERHVEFLSDLAIAGSLRQK